jgi:hypothetical protein
VNKQDCLLCKNPATFGASMADIENVKIKIFWLCERCRQNILRMLK